LSLKGTIFCPHKLRVSTHKKTCRLVEAQEQEVNHIAALCDSRAAVQDFISDLVAIKEEVFNYSTALDYSRAALQEVYEDLRKINERVVRSSYKCFGMLAGFGGEYR
jgi:hypothetical protein